MGYYWLITKYTEIEGKFLDTLIAIWQSNIIYVESNKNVGLLFYMSLFFYLIFLRIHFYYTLQNYRCKISWKLLKKCPSFPHLKDPAPHHIYFLFNKLHAWDPRWKGNPLCALGEKWGGSTRLELGYAKEIYDIFFSLTKPTFGAYFQVAEAS